MFFRWKIAAVRIVQTAEEFPKIQFSKWIISLAIKSCFGFNLRFDKCVKTRNRTFFGLFHFVRRSVKDQITENSTKIQSNSITSKLFVTRIFFPLFSFFSLLVFYMFFCDPIACSLQKIKLSTAIHLSDQCLLFLSVHSRFHCAKSRSNNSK